MSKIKLTSKGTELPLMSLKGKPYLQVAHRLVWFREDQPLGAITTEIVQLTEKYAVVKATIRIGNEIVATGLKRQEVEDFGDFVEKAETGAIGRALAVAGYGTQFEPALDEGDRLADSPISIPVKASNTQETVYDQTKPSSPSVPTSRVNPTPSGAKETSSGKTSQGASGIKENINKAASKLAGKGILKLEDFKIVWIKGKYNVEKLADLSDTQLTELYGSIKAQYSKELGF